jgi:hypothetical protein
MLNERVSPVKVRINDLAARVKYLGEILEKDKFMKYGNIDLKIQGLQEYLKALEDLNDNVINNMGKQTAEIARNLEEKQKKRESVDEILEAACERVDEIVRQNIESKLEVFLFFILFYYFSIILFFFIYFIYLFFFFLAYMCCQENKNNIEHLKNSAEDGLSEFNQCALNFLLVSF